MNLQEIARLIAATQKVAEELAIANRLKAVELTREVAGDPSWKAAIQEATGGATPVGRVVIRIEGGIGQVEEKPAGVEVVILDIDEKDRDDVVITRASVAEVVTTDDDEVLALLDGLSGEDER